jgi:hypothetical protein
MLGLHVPHGHDYEVAWCLVVCGVFKFRVEPNFLPSTVSTPNAAVFACSGCCMKKTFSDCRFQLGHGEPT